MIWLTAAGLMYQFLAPAVLLRECSGGSELGWQC